MKKTSAHFAVPVTTRDTSHSVTDDGTVGLCHADPQGEVKSLRPFPLGNGEGSREQKKRIQTQKIKEINRKDETIMAKDGTSRGGARPGAGRKPKAITEKVAAGNPGGRKLTVVDFGENAAELTGEEMPPVSEFMKAVQKDGSVLCAEDIFKTTWTWLRERRCDHLVPTQIIEQYAMAAARWVQCEEYVSTYGFLAKRANGSVANSPYVNISREYMKQANNIWYQIYQVVKENCTVELSGATPQDDVMERLLRVRWGI